MEFVAKNLDELGKVAENILKQFSEAKIFLLYGDLGSGKTNLVQRFCSMLGVEEFVSSPTFSIVNAYLAKGGTIYHIDLYRLKNLEEVIDIGIEEYLYSNHYCFIEWPELIEDLVPEHHKISIEILSDSSRKIIIL